MTFEMINGYILEYFYYIFLGLLFGYVILGRKGKDRNKTYPLFFTGLLFFLVMGSAVLTKQKNLPSYLPTVFFVLLFGSSFTMFKNRFFPYRFKCVNCGKRLNGKDIFLDEGYLCGDCKGESEESESEEEE